MSREDDAPILSAHLLFPSSSHVREKAGDAFQKNIFAHSRNEECPLLSFLSFSSGAKKFLHLHNEQQTFFFLPSRPRFPLLFFPHSWGRNKTFMRQERSATRIPPSLRLIQVFSRVETDWRYETSLLFHLFPRAKNRYWMFFPPSLTFHYHMDHPVFMGVSLSFSSLTSLTWQRTDGR